MFCLDVASIFCSNGFALMWVWFAPIVMRAVCSDRFDVALMFCFHVGVVCSNCDACCLLQWVVGPVVSLDRWIGVSWVKWWCGIGSVVADGFGLRRLVGFSMEIGGFLGLDRCCVCGFIGSSDGDFFFFWLGMMVAPMVGFWLGLN